MMIVLNQMPLSFYSSSGFSQFMKIIEPNYKPCREEAIKKRLLFLTQSLREKIMKELESSETVSCTTALGTSRGEDSYIALSAHVINNNWEVRSYTLSTHLINESHTKTNIAEDLKETFEHWKISIKIIAIVTDNAKNMLKAVREITVAESEELTCGSHTLQNAIAKAMSRDKIKSILKKARHLVGHFKHSTVAMEALHHKQELLQMNRETLLQGCKRRWNFDFLMFERFFKNRSPISNVLTDRSVTKPTNAKVLEISETEWSVIEKLIEKFIFKTIESFDICLL